MKFLLVLIVSFGVAFLVVFPRYGEVREATRRLAADFNERAQIDTYLQGKAVLLSAWPVKDAEFVAWGDDGLTTVREVRGDVWLASGRVGYTAEGLRTSDPWICFFQRKTGELVYSTVGGDTGRMLSAIKSGELDRFLADPVALRNSDPRVRLTYQLPPALMQKLGGDWYGGNVGPAPTPELSAGESIRNSMGLKGTTLDHPR